MKRNVLFITYDGLTDPLGQSQILPYYVGLTKRAYQISIVSAEKRENYAINKQNVSSILSEHNIKWKSVFYSNRPPFISTLKNIKKLKSLALDLAKEEEVEIVHCRSIIPAIIGDTVRKKLGAKLVFDIRGFWADERVDGGLWDLSNPVYRLIYNYFKRKEKYFFNSADCIVTLTENAKHYIQETYSTQGSFQVIPCCVDTNHFDPNQLKKEKINELKRKLNINENEYVLCYVGSLGTRYRLKDMLLFFKELNKLKENSKFLFISKSDTSEIASICKTEGIDEKLIRITSCEYKEIPNYISIANASIFFITTSFSGKAVSPTKQAEVMSLGLPIVANTGLGDTDSILKENTSGILVEDFLEDTLKKAANKLIDFKSDKKNIRNTAVNLFSLEKGIDKYQEVYQKL